MQDREVADAEIIKNEAPENQEEARQRREKQEELHVELTVIETTEQDDRGTWRKES
jgi:hypothetical protein